MVPEMPRLGPCRSAAREPAARGAVRTRGETTRPVDDTHSTDRDLRHDRRERTGGPGRPGGGLPHRTAEAAPTALEPADGVRRLGRRRPSGHVPSSSGKPSSTEHLSRVYESRKRPGVKLKLWVNYSLMGTNLRHTPEICLPSGGWTKVESLTRVFDVPSGEAGPRSSSRGWATAKVNWSGTSAFGTTFLVKASWRTTSAAFRSRVRAVTAGRRAAHR